MLENANVIVYNPTMEVYETVPTNAQGKYSAAQLPKGNGYFVKASKNDDVTNGVSTLDLVLVQRHILGLAPLEGPYNLIASDANNDNNINASDLLSLRKVILGVILEFPNDQESWRFLPKDVTFDDVDDPFPYDEEINVGNLQSSSNNNDLIAVKIGDVNGNVTTNAKSETASSTRAEKTMSFVIDNAQVESGDRISIPVYANGIESMVGHQYTMNLNDAEYVSVESGQLEISDDNFGIYDGVISASWTNPEGIEINDYEPLFTLVLDVQSTNEVANIISINSDITSAEAYDTDFDTYNVTLETRSNDLEEGEFALFQNRPNPFMESTNIKFFLPKAGNVELIITDVTGKLVTRKVQKYPAGTQNVEINYSDLGVSGVLYYTIKAGQYKATKKMINVR